LYRPLPLQRRFSRFIGTSPNKENLIFDDESLRRMRDLAVSPKLLVLIGDLKMTTRKGGVAISVVRGRTRLRWKAAGRETTLVVGRAEDLLAQLKAEQVALQIAIDLASEPPTYDPTLQRYRAMIDPSRPLVSAVGVLDLFNQFYKYRSADLERNSKTKWEAVRGHLSAFGQKTAAQVDGRLCGVFMKSLGHLSTETQRSYLAILRACWTYGMLRYGLAANPWELIRLPRSERPEPDPFTLPEVASILAGFVGNHYRPYVCGLLGLGCRPGEAAALTWGDFDWETDSVSINKSWDGQAVKSTKTRKVRVVPVVASLRSLLRSHRPEDWQPDQLVFPAPRGGYVNVRIFLRRHWRPTLERAGVRYRPTYKCRHTVWSHAILTMPIAEAAKIAGNLPSTLLSSYIGSVSASPMPDLLQTSTQLDDESPNQP
jgi:integrase